MASLSIVITLTIMIKKRYQYTKHNTLNTVQSQMKKNKLTKVFLYNWQHWCSNQTAYFEDFKNAHCYKLNKWAKCARYFIVQKLYISEFIFKIPTLNIKAKKIVHAVLPPFIFNTLKLSLYVLIFLMLV